MNPSYKYKKALHYLELENKIQYSKIIKKKIRRIKTEFFVSYFFCKNTLIDIKK